MVRFPVGLTGLLAGDHAFRGVRGCLLVGLVAVNVRGFPGEFAGRSSCRLRTSESLWFESLEFLANQGCTALGNLVLSRRDSLLADVRSTVPAEKVARLRYSPLTETVSIFPSPLLDSALTKMQAAANDALVQRTLHPPRIPRKPAAAGGSAGTAASGSGQVSSSGARPAQKQTSSSSPSGQTGKKRKNRKGKAPFSSSSGGSGRSGGKGKGAGKKSA